MDEEDLPRQDAEATKHMVKMADVENRTYNLRPRGVTDPAQLAIHKEIAALMKKKQELLQDQEKIVKRQARLHAVKASLGTLLGEDDCCPICQDPFKEEEHNFAVLD